MPEAVRRLLIEFTARTVVSASMSVPSRSGDNKTKLEAICSEVAQRGSTFHVGERVTRSEVSELIHSFPQALRLFLRQHPDEEFDLHQIEKVLQDCVDLIREATEAGKTSASATLENSITAFVAFATVSTTSAPTLQGSHRTIDDEESRTTPSAFPARTASAKRHAPMFGNGDEERQEKRPVRPLPQSSATMTRIDLKTDPRVFAVLDDGCNCTCHTPAFIDHMRAVLESDGKELSPLVGEARQYTGIGGCRATRWTLCCCSPQRNLEDRMLPCCPRAYDDLLALALSSALFSAILKLDGMQEVFRLYTDVDDVRMRLAVWREAVLERIGVVHGTLNHEMSNRMLDSSSCKYLNLPMAV